MRWPGYRNPEGRTGARAGRRRFLRIPAPETGGTPRTRHLCTNLIIEFDDETHARTRTYFVVFQGTDTLPLQPIITGGYHDKLEKVDGDWRFTERRELVGETGDLSAHLLQTYAGPTGE